MIESFGNDLPEIIAQALNEMKSLQGSDFSLENVNLAELSRRTGYTRARLRRLKANGFRNLPDSRTGRKSETTVLSGFTATLDGFLKQGISNSAVCYSRIREKGYTGSRSTVRDYISKHKDLIPAPRATVAPQGNRGRRYSTGPEECYQMDWGFVKVLCHDGRTYKLACFAMICHHCGFRYVEFFPNAKQENLFIGMIHAFSYMGVPEYVLTDNMKSVVKGRDSEGKPIWNGDYGIFMKAIGFNTKLCKARHPYTKGKVERLIQFVKGNFLAGRTFWNVTDMNEAALSWCDDQNRLCHREAGGIPEAIHTDKYCDHTAALVENDEVRKYLCPLRKVSFDGFVSLEGRRFGVPASHTARFVRVCRDGKVLSIYSEDMVLLVTHEVTWSKHDSYCDGQFQLPQPEEFPTAPVRTVVRQLDDSGERDDAFASFSFMKEELWNE